MSAGIPGAVYPGLFAEKVIEWLYWDIPQFGVLRSRTLLARAEALSCYANVASRFLVLTRTPCVQPWLASSSHRRETGVANVLAGLKVQTKALTTLL